jgi:hypothetical protein
VSNHGARPSCFSSTVQEVLFVITVTMSIGMSSFVSGMMSVITASIGRDLNVNSAKVTWITPSSSHCPSLPSNHIYIHIFPSTHEKSISKSIG